MIPVALLLIPLLTSSAADAIPLLGRQARCRSIWRNGRRGVGAREGLVVKRHRAREAMPQVVIAYRIREVDGRDDDIADVLTELHRLTFFSGASVPDFDHGNWWLVYRKATPIAFAGLVPSTYVRNAGYFCRVGVLQPHWGHSLQLRLMRAIEARARRNGWACVVSDMTRNVASANNFIRAGYRMFWPPYPWAFPDTLYWRKSVVLDASSHSTHSKRR